VCVLLFSEYLSLGWIIAVTVIVGLIAGVLFWKKDQLRFVIVGALWYLLTLGPTLGLLRAGNNLAADRYTYLPLLGVVIGMAGLFSFLVTKKSKPVALGILFAIAVVISIVSFQQIGHWRSQEALFSNVIKNEPENVIARVELATLAHRMGEDDRAAGFLYPVLEKIPNDPGAHLVLGHIDYKVQKYSEAYEHYEIAARIRSREAFIEERLAASAHGTGDMSKTKQHMIRAFKLRKADDKQLDLVRKWNLLFPNEPEP